MSANDAIVLDGILADRMTVNNQDEGRVFEKFAFEQILKEYALTSNQIDDGWVDGGGDGGIDGLYVIVNGYPYGGDDGFQWPRENPHITVWVITCKHREGFIESPLASMYMTLSEFWDCSKGNDELKGDYSESLMDARLIFLRAYSALAHLDPLVDVRIAYATRGDTDKVSDAIKGRMRQLESQVAAQFSKSSVHSSFFGAKELLQLYRKIRDENLILPFEASLTHDENNYVVIVTLSDYFDFVKDSEGKLRRYLFDSNVRDFLGYNNVNGDIDETLKNPTPANFWWLNNGITILADNAHVKGKNLYLNGVQIVNGLQTTETVYRHFAAGHVTSADKNLLVKVITSQDEEVRASIIQATNNQSNVMSYSLHATDDVQRNIEEILRKDRIYYERRDHYYKNEGMPLDWFITPLDLAKSFLSVVYKNPATAAGLKNKFMRNAASYNAVFCSDFPIDKWSLIAFVWLVARKVFRGKIITKFNGVDCSHQWMPLVSCCIIAKIVGTFRYTTKDIKQIKLTDISIDVVEAVWEWVVPHIGKYKATSRNKLKKPNIVYNFVLQEMVRTCKYEGIEEVNRKPLPRTFNKAESGSCSYLRRSVAITDDFITDVKKVLPSQPWKPGVHRDIARKLNVHPTCVYDAIDILIERREAYKQKDGIVYGNDGRAILVDNMRCSMTVAGINAQIEQGKWLPEIK